MSVRDREVEATYLARLKVREVIPGWDTANGYVLIRGRLDFGLRRTPFEETLPAAWQMLACVEKAVPDWNVVDDMPEPIAQQQPEFGWSWPWLYELTKSWGVSAALVDVVEDAYPEGEWRRGDWPGIKKPMPWALARIVEGDVVAVVAPAEIAR